MVSFCGVMGGSLLIPKGKLVTLDVSGCAFQATWWTEAAGSCVQRVLPAFLRGLVQRAGVFCVHLVSCG